MRQQVQKFTGWLQMLLLLPIAALIIIDWKGIFSRRKHLSTHSGSTVDSELRQMFKQAIEQPNFPPLEKTILTAVSWDYWNVQVDPHRRLCYHWDSIRGSIHKLSGCLSGDTDIAFNNVLLAVCDKYADKPICGQSNEHLSRQEILSLSQRPTDHLQARTHFLTLLKIVQSILFHYQYPTQPFRGVQPVLEDTATPPLSMDDGKIGDMEQKFHYRLLFARAIRETVLHRGLKDEGTLFVYYALSIFTQPGDKRFVRRHVIDAVDFKQIRQCHSELSPELLKQAKQGDVTAIIQAASFIMLANSKWHAHGCSSCMRQDVSP